MNKENRNDCNKIGFSNRSEASQQAKRIKARRGKKSKGFNTPYKCAHCNLWHLTSKQYNKRMK